MLSSLLKPFLSQIMEWNASFILLFIESDVDFVKYGSH